METISKVLIYTDRQREWITNSLIDMLLEEEISVSLAYVDEFSEDDLIDVHKSLLLFDENYLIVALTSNINENYNMIAKLFNEKQDDYLGYSLFLDQIIEDVYITDFLNFNHNTLVSRMNRLMNSEFSITGLQTKLTPNIRESFVKNKRIPGSELLFDIGKLEGELRINGSISPYMKDGQIIHYLGPVSEPFSLIFEQGRIIGVDTDKTSLLLEKIENLLEDVKVLNIGIGIGHNNYHPPGKPAIDRYFGDVITLYLENSMLISTYQGEIEFTK